MSPCGYRRRRWPRTRRESQGEPGHGPDVGCRRGPPPGCAFYVVSQTSIRAASGPSLSSPAVGCHTGWSRAMALLRIADFRSPAWPGSTRCRPAPRPLLTARGRLSCRHQKNRPDRAMQAHPLTVQPTSCRAMERNGAVRSAKTLRGTFAVRCQRTAPRPRRRGYPRVAVRAPRANARDQRAVLLPARDWSFSMRSSCGTAIPALDGLASRRPDRYRPGYCRAGIAGCRRR